jgi:hypothetical protein
MALHVVVSAVALALPVRAQEPGVGGGVRVGSPSPPAAAPGPAANPSNTGVTAFAVGWQPATASSATVAAPGPRMLDDRVQAMQSRMADLNRQLILVQAAAGQDEKLKSQVDLLQKQIELQQKMIQLLMDHAKKEPIAGSPVEKLQSQVATLEARSLQAAQRDVDVAQQIDSMIEHQDAVERGGPQLPASLKELFLLSGTNETPLSIYGTLALGYSKIVGDPSTAAKGTGRPFTPGGFYFGEFTPDFLLKLNDWMLLEAEIGIGSDGSVSAGSFAQADFFVTDWLTVSTGRMVAPIGFYNFRLNNPWINKLPGDAPGSGPLLWQQVLPTLSLLGVQAAGACYLGDSPFKLEYNAYLTNGLNLAPATPGAPTANELANLQNMGSTFASVTNKVAGGGRIGLWWPEAGWATGVSGFYNPDYVAGSSGSLWIGALDLSYHKGNWDARVEYGTTHQQAAQFQASDITRQGVYAQIAYRPRDAAHPILQNLEFVYRYTYVDFKGIDPTSLDLTQFSTPMDLPVRRQQNEIGINYYFYPRMVLKCALQINDEPGFHLHDNQFLAEFAWGF